MINLIVLDDTNILDILEDISILDDINIIINSNLKRYVPIKKYLNKIYYIDLQKYPETKDDIEKIIFSTIKFINSGINIIINKKTEKSVILEILNKYELEKLEDKIFYLECNFFGIEIFNLNYVFYKLSRKVLGKEIGRERFSLIYRNIELRKFFTVHISNVENESEEGIENNLNHNLLVINDKSVIKYESRKNIYINLGESLIEGLEKYNLKNTLSEVGRKDEVAFYTCFFGTNENVSNVINRASENFSCFYISNNRETLIEARNLGWETVYIDEELTNNINKCSMMSKIYKCRPDIVDVLNTYKITIYIDSKNIVFYDEIYKIIEKCNYPLMIKINPIVYDGVWNEYNESINGQERYKSEREKIKNFIVKKTKEGYSEKGTMLWTTLIIRNMKSNIVKEINSKWYEYVKECGIQCQVSFFFIYKEYFSFIAKDYLNKIKIKRGKRIMSFKMRNEDINDKGIEDLPRGWYNVQNQKSVYNDYGRYIGNNKENAVWCVSLAGRNSEYFFGLREPKEKLIRDYPNTQLFN